MSAAFVATEIGDCYNEQDSNRLCRAYPSTSVPQVFVARSRLFGLTRQGSDLSNVDCPESHSIPSWMCDKSPLSLKFSPPGRLQTLYTYRLLWRLLDASWSQLLTLHTFMACFLGFCCEHRWLLNSSFRLRARLETQLASFLPHRWSRKPVLAETGFGPFNSCLIPLVIESHTPLCEHPSSTMSDEGSLAAESNSITTTSGSSRSHSTES